MIWLKIRDIVAESLDSLIGSLKLAPEEILNTGGRSCHHHDAESNPSAGHRGEYGGRSVMALPMVELRATDDPRRYRAIGRQHVWAANLFCAEEIPSRPPNSLSRGQSCSRGIPPH